MTGDGSAIRDCLGYGADEAKRRVLARLQPYVEAETTSRNVEAITTLAVRLEQEFRLAGATVEILDAPDLGRNLRATVPGPDPTLEPLLVLAHIDTVHPVGSLAERPFRVNGDRVEGPGTYDMKGGLAIMMEALSHVTRTGAGPRRPVRFLITCDEEIGSHAARDMMRESARDAFAALVPEPSLPDGGVKTQRKGVSTYRLEVHGRAAHAGHDNLSAVSAITEIASQIGVINSLANRNAGTSVNVGMLGGGTASNVVAARAWADIDVRFVETQEGDRIDRALHGLTPAHDGARLEMVRAESRPALQRTNAIADLYGFARSLASELGVDLTEGMSGGGSDGSLVAAWGLPVLDGLGPRGGGAHAVDEHILLSDLAFRLGLYVRLLETL